MKTKLRLFVLILAVLLAALPAIGQVPDQLKYSIRLQHVPARELRDVHGVGKCRQSPGEMRYTSQSRTACASEATLSRTGMNSWPT